MRRLLVVVLTIVAVSVWAAPGYAAVGVSIRVDRAVLMSGESVTVTGKAMGAARGSVVRLQRRVEAGWRTVASTRVRSKRSYRFTIKPPKGYQSYRVFKPRQLGRASAVSRVVRLTVKWRPTVVLGEVSHDVDERTGAATTRARGRTAGLPVGAELRRELRQPDGRWAAIGRIAVAADHTWRDVFASTHGDRVRYTASASGARLAASTATFVVDGSWTPTITATATMDSLTDDVRVTGNSTGLPEGSAVQREYLEDGSWIAEGSPSAVAVDGTFSDSFTVTLKRSYRYTAPAVYPRREASSATFEFTDAPTARVTLGGTIGVGFASGETERTLSLHLEDGQTFTYFGWNRTLEVAITDPDGESMRGLSAGETTVTNRARVTGDYTIRLTRPWSIAPWRSTYYVVLSAPVEYTTSLDAPGIDVTSTLPGQLVEVTFAAQGGSVVSEYGIDEEDPSGLISLLDPAGAVVPRWGERGRDGGNWKLPEVDGDYRLRIEPYEYGYTIARHDQSVLAAHEATAVLDGAPAHISLDRPGRVGVVTVTVPAGLDVRFSDTGPDFLSEELFGPDGQLIETGSESPDVSPSAAGTYTQLVSYTGTAEVDYYATTPVSYEAALGSTVAFEQGPAPDRRALIHIPVTAGQLFSFEILDDAGAACLRSTYVHAGSELLDWLTWGSGHPSVVKVARTGELVLTVTPCTATGMFRPQSTAIVPSSITATSSTADGYPTTTSAATLEATAPGQLMMVEYDAGVHGSNRLRLSSTDSSFPPGTHFSVAMAGTAGASSSSGIGTGTPDTFPVTVLDQIGPRYFFVYAGPTATGTLDLQFDRTDF